MLTKEFMRQFNYLQPNTQIHVNHENCSAGVDVKRRLYIKRTGDGVLLAYCHHCGEAGVYREGKTKVSLKTLTEQLEQAAKREGDTRISLLTGCPLLPPDVDFNVAYWPTWARDWLMSYGITGAEQCNHNIAYSKELDRVIIPTYNLKGQLVFWQGRAAPGAAPKYITKQGLNKPVTIVGSRINKNIFVVEDMLSAIKIGRYAPAIPLLGTTTHLKSLVDLLNTGGYQNVFIYLDPDPAGMEASVMLHKDLRTLLSTSIEVRNITLSELVQPKEMPDHELERLVNGL